MKKTLTQVLETPRPNELQDKTLDAIRTALGSFGDNGKTVYDSQTIIDPVSNIKIASFDDIKKILGSYGFAEEISNKYLGILVEKWFENTTPTPKYSEASVADATRSESLGKTTISERTDEQIFTEAAKRNADIAKTRENQSKAVEDFKKRGEAIYAEQQKIQDQILKSKEVEPEIAKIKDWKIKVEEVEKVQLTSEEKTVFDDYKKQIHEATIISDEAKRIEEINQIKIGLAREIHTRAEPALKAQGLEKEESDYVVIKTAEKIVGEIQASESSEYLPPMAQLAIHTAVLEKVQTIPTTVISTKTRETLLSSIGTTTKFRLLPDVYLKNVAEIAFGRQVAKTIFGSSYNVSISEEPTQGYVYTFNFSKANEDGRQIQSQQNQTLETLKGLGQQEAKTFLLDNTAAYFAKSPVGTKMLASKNAQVAFYSVFKGAGKTVTWTSESFVGNAVLRFIPEYAPILNITTGTRFVTPVVSLSGAAIGTSLAAQTAATVTSVTFTGGIMAGEAFAGGAGAAAAGAAAGTTIAPIIGTAIGAVIGAIFGKVASAAKVWWTKHKEKIKPVLTVLGTLAAIRFLGVGPGLGVGAVATFGLMGTAGLTTIATGAFNLFGFIGRSIGVAIATPVIVTLLVLPPLVAFIMLVINNSAYIVPPRASTLATIGQVVSPYIDIQKVANPAGPFQNSDLPKTIEYTVTIIAKKSNLTNIKLKDDCTVRKKSGTTQCPKIDPELPDTSSLSISPTNSYSFKYSMTFDATNFIDSRVSNSITITADSDGNTTTAVGSASVKFGNPPEDCPADWPVYPEDEPYLVILQGPHTSGGTHDVIEAIDIFSPDEPNTTDIIGNQIKATHQGKVLVGSGGNYGRFVDITSSCVKTDGNEVEVTSRYAHLSAVSVTTGQIAGKDQTIGLAGSSGTPYPHLHYEFRPAPGPVPMRPPYLPKTIPIGCYNGGGKPCGITY